VLGSATTHAFCVNCLRWVCTILH